MKPFGYIISAAASFVVFVFGVYLFITAGSSLPRVDALLSALSSESSAVQPLAVDVSSFDWVYSWDEQPSQGIWAYDLFTPQTLWRDALTQQLVSSVPQSVLNAEDWGVTLLSLDRQWYRLQFEGYTEGGALARGKAKLYFGDLVYGKRVVGYVGSRIPKARVRVLAFDPDARETRAGLTPSRNPEVVILDEITGEEIVLKQRDPQYTSRWVARVDVPGMGELGFNEVGESHVLGNVRVRIDSVDFEMRSVTLQREDLATGKVEYAVLSQ